MTRTNDDGSKFLNHALVAYRRQHGLAFTRSRPHRKNDNAHVEQKNGALVRCLVGDDRYSSHAAYDKRYPIGNPNL